MKRLILKLLVLLVFLSLLNSCAYYRPGGRASVQCPSCNYLIEVPLNR